jgi:asparagine synthase (glutamine-hydrolysing)
VYRYLALIWNPTDEGSARAAVSLCVRLENDPAGWSRVLESPGVVAWHAERYPGSSDVHPLGDSAGVVFGRIFTRDIETPELAACVTFDGAESARIVASRGERLLEKYWGRYVALLRDGSTGEVAVLRDPSGGFPCWITSHERIHLVCSDIEDCRRLGVGPFTVNWDYIEGFVAHAQLQIRATALNEVSELQPGERLLFSAEKMRRSIEWQPIDIARNAPIESVDEAVTALRATTVGCVQTWAACYGGIVHNLSGGLDSSIVLSCLATAPTRPRLLCLNYFGTGPQEDERRYARAVAQHTGAELIEQQLDVKSVRLEELLSLRRSPRPWFYLYEIEHGGFEGELATRHGAQSLFSGAGGDGVFFQAHAELALTDYLFEHGVGPGLLRTAVDAAHVSRKSIWRLLWQALRTRALQPQWDPLALVKPPTRTIVNSELLASMQGRKGFAHPWLTPEATRGVPPGVLWHILSIATPPAYYNSFQGGRYPERTLPLLSQPLVELCLRIPTYLLIESGWDRALARRAFERDLPAEIVQRRLKGRVDQHVRNILDENLGFARELLLDGYLVRRGLLNRSALELYLTRNRSPADFQYGEILHEHACTEAWLRSWLTTACAAGG